MFMLKEIQIVIIFTLVQNRIKLAQYGISVNEIMEIINFAIGGSPITYSIFRLCSTKRNL